MVEVMRFFLLVALLGGAFSAPLKDDVASSEYCARYCLRMNNNFVYFNREKSYIFDYKGKSHVDFKGVSPPATSDLDIEAQVQMSFNGICDFVLQIKNPVINGVKGNKEIEELLKYPITAAVVTGAISDVCAHENDTAAGLNFKKGIISTLQNSLPHFFDSLSTTITETDVVGVCPTFYSVDKSKSYMNVTKTKNHKECTGRKSESVGSPMSLWLKTSSLSWASDSRSECYLTYGSHDLTPKSAGCTDVKEIILDNSRKAVVTQTHSLQLRSVLDGKIVPPMNIMKSRKTDLIFETLPDIASVSEIPKAKKNLKKLCDEVKDSLKEESAFTFGKVIDNLQRLPKDELPKLLAEIKAGKICSNHERLESLYLDAMSYINNPGAVQVMVDQVVSGKVSGGRTFLYTVALQLMKKPSIHSVKTVAPLFESKSVPSSMMLAAGSLVRKYCNLHDNCLQEKDIREILQKLSNKIDSMCPHTKTDREKKLKTLAVLKSIGNIGVVSKPLENSILKCLNSKEADTFVRVSSAQAFRQVSCDTRPVENMIELASELREDTEVRIASYLGSITCASYEQTKILLAKTIKDPNPQVQSFILSHLRSLQKSDAPYLRKLRYNLATLSIPTNDEKTSRKLSRHSDMSYYMPTLKMGAGVESCVIYSPDSYIPRQIGTNITLDLLDNVINLGEYSLRIEDLETILNAIFGREGLLKNSQQSKIVHDLMAEIGQKGHEIHKYLTTSGSKPELGSLKHIIESLNIFKEKSKVPKFDAFARIFGQEISFTSLSLKEEDFTVNEIFNDVLTFMEKIFIDTQYIKPTSSARGLQLRADYFIPTAQGIPLQIKGVAMQVMALDPVDLKVPSSKSKTSPVVSTYINLFLGYNIGAKSGLRVRSMSYVRPRVETSLVSTSKNIEFNLDLPKKVVRAIDFSYNCSMVNKMPEGNDEKIYPKQKYPVRVDDKCIGPENGTSLNVLICWHLKSPDFIKAHIFPFGDVEFTLDISKVQKDKEILKVMTNAKYEVKEKSFDLKVEAPGTKNPELAELSLVYKVNSDSKSFLVFVQGRSKIGRAVQINMKHRKSTSGSQRNILIYYSNKKQMSSTDQVMVLKMKESKRETRIRKEFSLKTKQNLARYVDTSIEVDFLTDAVLNPSKLMDINKMEFSVIVPKKFNTTHHIRKIPTTDDKFVYDVYSLTKSPSEEYFKVVGNYSVKGEFSQLTRLSETALSLTFVKTEYKFLTQHCWTKQRKHFLYSLKNVKNNKPTFLAEADLNQTSVNSVYGLHAQLECPKLIPTYRLDGKLFKKSLQDISVEIDLKEDGVVTLKGEGTLNLQKTPEMFSEKSEIKITHVGHSKEFLVRTSVYLSNDTKDAWLDLTANGIPVISAEVDLVSKGGLLTSSVGLTIPEIVDAKLKAEKTRTLLQMVLNSYIQPNTVHSRKIKASGYFNFFDKEVKARVAYDLENNPNKKVDFRTRYDYDNEKKFALLRGELTTFENSYVFGAETMLGSLSKDPNNKNLIEVKLLTNNGKEFIFRSECLNTKNKPYRTTVHSIHLQTVSGSRHDLKGEYKYDFSEAPEKMMIVGHTEVDSPLVKFVLSLDTALNVDQLRQKGHYKMKIEGERISSPIIANFGFDNQGKELKANGLIDLGTSMNIKINGDGKMIRSDERKVRDLTMQVTLDLPEHKNYNFRANKDSKSLVLDLSFNGKVLLEIEQASPKKGVWFVKVTTPLRRTEAHSELTTDSMIFALYPNRIDSEDKYEVEGHFIQSVTSLETGARLRYPKRKNDVKFQVNISKKNQLSKGTVELDIFDTPQDKVVIEIQTNSIMPEGFHIVADVKVPNQESVPRIEVDLGLEEGMQLFAIFIFKDKSSAQPEISSGMIAFEETNKTTLVYSELETKYEKIRMVSEIKHHELLQCMGKTFNGSVQTTKYGSFDFKSALCSPGYVEFGAKKHSEDKIYITKLGMKRHTAVKAALDLVFDSSNAITPKNFWDMETTFNLYGRHEYLPKLPMALLGAKVWWSRFVTIDATYNTTGLKEYYENVVKPASERVRQVASDLSKELPKEIRENILLKLPKLAVELSTEIHNLGNMFHKELKNILEELGLTMPNFKELEEKVSKFLENAGHVYDNMIKKLDEILDKYGVREEFHKIVHIYHLIDKKIEGFLIKAAKELEKMLDQVRRGEFSITELPPMEWLSNKLGFNPWEWFKEKWRHFKNWMMNKFKNFMHFVHRVVHYFTNIFRKIWNRILNIPFVRKFVDWFKNLFHFDDWLKDNSLIGSLISKYYWFSVTPESGLIRLQLPVKQSVSVSSLSVAMNNVGISLPKKHSNHMKHMSLIERVIPPTRASMEDGTLVSLYRYELPLTFSKCEILMLNVYGDKVTAVIPNKQQTVLKIKLKAGEDVVIQMKKSSAPETELLKGMNSVIIPGMIMERISDKEIRMNLQGFELDVKENKVSVKVRPWAVYEDAAKGLMGRFYWEGDHLQLTKEEARKLMLQYKISPICEIPKQ